MIQETQVYEHLTKVGPIDAITAFNEYRIMRLAAVIFNLRAAGVPIETVIKHKTTDGKTVRWAEYKIAAPRLAPENGKGVEADFAGGFALNDNTDQL